METVATVTSLSRIKPPATKQRWFRSGLSVNAVTWPPNCPDLKPVAHLWDGLLVRGLVDSMPRRDRALLAAKGGSYTIFVKC